MSKWAYYNEIDPFAAAWLRKLIEAGHVADGEVDERDIRDVHPADLRRFAQVHMFAGIGGWSRALRLASWGDDRPVWTGSCPCQPFSQAGRGGGVTDERHLWPHFHHLIRECNPGRVYGEQVSSPDGLSWFDLVQADLEGSGYAATAVDICAASVGAPHIRQRLYWMADAESGGRGKHWVLGQASGGREDTGQFELFDAVGRVGQSAEQGSQGQQDRRVDVCGQGRSSVERAGGELVGRVEDGERPSPTNGFWADPDWLFCRDVKWRPVKPGTFVLASGFPNRMGLLRGFGNAIVPPLAAEFIKATM